MTRGDAAEVMEIILNGYVGVVREAIVTAIAALREQDNRPESDTVKVVDSDQFKGWISVVGNDRYMVNCYGDIMNAETGMILKQAKNKAGYRKGL